LQSCSRLGRSQAVKAPGFDPGKPIGKLALTRFSDGETSVEIQENVRGGDVFVVQPVCYPTNDNLMDLLVTVDALKRASADRITAVIPYYGYARQDRRVRSARVPITAKLVANMLSVAGVDRVLTVDVHAEQIQGFFDIPVDNVYASPTCIIIDDMVDTAGTLCKAAEALKEHGAEKVVALATHPVLSGNAIHNLDGSMLDELVITDTIPLSEAAQGCARIRQLSVADLLGETIRRIHEDESVSSVYMD